MKIVCVNRIHKNFAIKYLTDLLGAPLATLHNGIYSNHWAVLDDQRNNTVSIRLPEEHESHLTFLLLSICK